MSDRRLRAPAAVLLLVAAGFLGSCSTTGNTDTIMRVEIPAASMSYIVLAWSDFGMHFFSPTYDKDILLPPYSTLWAQVIKRGDPPEIVTSGVTLEYRLIGNTTSYDKREYGQFWDNALDIFGVDLAVDTGLNLVDPDVHNGLSGTMILKGNHFQVDGVPAVPVDDAGTWDPYQVAEIIVRDSTTGAELVRTQATVPVSDEINCAKCHGQGDVGSVLASHDELEETTFVEDGLPVLCADCHGTLALGREGAGSSERYLSEAVHSSHALTSTSCYDCHPGATTLSHRSTAHTSSNGNCTTCHGTASDLAVSVVNGRIPWTGEPRCATCHTFVAGVDTGTTLYHAATGHNGVSCPACHGSPHAEVPSSQAADNYQFIQYQNKAVALGSCRVCHSGSKGGGLTGIVQAHGGTEPTSCVVCHTGPITTNNPVEFPHRFQNRVR